MSTEQEIDSLRRTINRIIESLQVSLGTQKQDKSEVASVLSIVLELAAREGLSEAHVLEVFRLRSDLFFQRSLENIEDVSPSLAARLETIIPSKSDPAADWPALFPEDEP